MRKFFLFTFAVVALLLTGSVSAQISHGGLPLYNHAAVKVKALDVQLPTVDNQRLLDEDAAQIKSGHPLRVGAVQRCEIDLLKSATALATPAVTTYMLSVTSPGASFVELHFSHFRLPAGATLFIYDASGEFVLGSFNSSDVKADGSFYTQAIPGSTVYVEYSVPAMSSDCGTVVIDRVTHGYKDLFSVASDNAGDLTVEEKGAHGNAEGDCHINVACAEGDDWRDQIRATVAIEIIDQLYSYMCSGALINNARQDRTPYVLSAHHCQDIENPPVASFIFYFRYQTKSCNSQVTYPNRSLTGASMKAKYDGTYGSDFLLLLLDNEVPDTYEPYYAGWDRSNVANPTPGACIHHPGGDVKKISIPRTISRYNNRFYDVRWYTGSAMKGVTEQGSSGSPLFNADKRIIGQLYAGESSCSYPQGGDIYGRLYYSWNSNEDSTGRLVDWLDPDRTGITTLDGLDYTVGIDGPAEPRPLKVYPNPSNGMVHFDVDAIGDANFKVFDLAGRCLLEGRTILTATSQAVNLSSLPSGSYTLLLITSNAQYKTPVVIVK